MWLKLRYPQNQKQELQVRPKIALPLIVRKKLQNNRTLATIGTKCQTSTQSGQVELDHGSPKLVIETEVIRTISHSLRDIVANE
jgi:hypothetical protein